MMSAPAMPAVIEIAAMVLRVMLMVTPAVMVSGRFPVDTKHWATT
jgi:hypothetical protein